MKRNINNFLTMMGFKNLQDLTGVPTTISKDYTIIATSVGTIFSFIFGVIEKYSGFPMIFWFFLLFGAFLDILVGWWANVKYLGHDFETKKFYRGIFKTFVVYMLIFLTYSFYLSFKNSKIEIEFIKTTAVYLTLMLHYSITMLIGLYLLFGIAENGAKMEIPIFVSISKILKMKINNIEESGSLTKKRNK